MLTYKNSAVFSRGAELPVQLRNFWEPEEGFVWSTGRWCEIIFAFQGGPKENASGSELILEVDAFRSGDDLPGQNLMAYLNGLRIASFFCKERAMVVAPFDTKVLREAENNLTIDTPDAARPSDFGSADKRLLGIQMFSLQVRKT